jgi:hypothetical protein
MSGTLGRNNLYRVDEHTASITEFAAAAVAKGPAADPKESDMATSETADASKPYSKKNYRLLKGSFGLLRAGSAGELNTKQLLHRRDRGAHQEERRGWSWHHL